MIRKTRRRKTAILVCVWIVFMAVVGLFFLQAEKQADDEAIRSELTRQADIITAQIPTMLENNYFTQYAAVKMRSAKLKALAWALEDVQDIEEARPLLDDYVENADIRGLSIYDRDGSILYTDGDSARTLSREEFELFRDYDSLQYYDQLNADPKALRNLFFSSLVYTEADTADGKDVIGEDADGEEAGEEDATGNLTDQIFGHAKDGEWFVIMTTGISESELAVRERFDWRRVLSSYTIGQGGSLLAVDETTGVVLASGDVSSVGAPVEKLDYRVGQSEHAAALAELKETFSEAGRIVTLRKEEQEYFAVRLALEDSLILAMIPTDDPLSDGPRGATAMRVVLMLLATGIGTLYICFQMQTPAKAVPLRKSGKWRWNKTLSGRVTAYAVLLGIFIFAAGLFLEVLFAHADNYNYCRQKVAEAGAISVTSETSRADIPKLFEEAYLDRCRVARIILDHTSPEKINWDTLEQLSGSLNVNSIHVFDAQGQVVATNSFYDRLTVDADDPFHELLEGREDMTGKITLEGDSEQPLMRVGVARRDSNHHNVGLVMVLDTAEEMNTILTNLNPNRAFQRLCARDHTQILVIDANTEVITYCAEVEGGVYSSTLGQYDHTGLQVSMFGIGEDVLRDEYNGSLKFMGKSCLASVTRVGDAFLMILVPDIRLGQSSIVRALLNTGLLLVFLMLALLITCLGRPEDFASEEAESETIPANRSGRSARAARGKRKIEMASLFGGFVDTRKPNFRERWKSDTKTWKEKTATEKFHLLLRLIMIAVFAAVAVNYLEAGSESYWYYLFKREQTAGFNLYAISSSLVYICMLMVLKMVIHKILFLAAKVANAWGETVCLLLDSALSYLLGITAILICLAQLGLNLREISLTAGVGAVLFSIGCQNTLSDILSGFLMAFEGSVHVGDFLLYNGKPANVLSISLRATQLKFFNETTVIRNNDFRNYVLRPTEEYGLVSVSLTIDPRESLERAETIFQEELPSVHKRICELCGDPMLNGPNYGGVKGITENGTELAFSLNPRGKDAHKAQLETNRALRLICEHRGITIAMPQVVVHEPISGDGVR